MARQPEPWRRAGCGDAWYAQVDRKQTWLAPPEASKTEAWRVLRRKLAEARKPAPRRDDRPDVREVTNWFLAHVDASSARGECERVTFDGYRRYLSRAAGYLGAVEAEELRPRHVLEWLDRGQPTWGATSRFNAVTAVKACIRWAWKTGRIASNPLAGMDRPRPDRREEVPTGAQINDILDAIRDRPFRDLLVALVETGARPGELMTLEADRVFPREARWSVINKTRRKTGQKTRDVYLTPEMVALSDRLLEQHPEGLVFRNLAGGPWTRHLVAHRMARLAARLGMGKEACAYAIRHAFVTRALVNGVPVATVATLVGHTSTKMIMQVYSKLGREKEHLRAAAVRSRAEVPE